MPDPGKRLNDCLVLIKTCNENDVSDCDSYDESNLEQVITHKKELNNVNKEIERSMKKHFQLYLLMN